MSRIGEETYQRTVVDVRNWRERMKRFGLLAVATVTGLMSLTQAQALTRLDSLSGIDRAPVEKTQFLSGGRQYCFYPDGWRGPGFYWCGYAQRRGFGWGGPAGWRGWAGPGGRPGFHNGPMPRGPYGGMRGPSPSHGGNRDHGGGREHH